MYKEERQTEKLQLADLEDETRVLRYLEGLSPNGYLWHYIGAVAATLTLANMPHPLLQKEVSNLLAVVFMVLAIRDLYVNKSKKKQYGRIKKTAVEGFLRYEAGRDLLSAHQRLLDLAVSKRNMGDTVRALREVSLEVMNNEPTPRLRDFLQIIEMALARPETELYEVLEDVLQMVADGQTESFEDPDFVRQVLNTILGYDED